MNYRHAFHAGNFADVFKHWLEIEILDYLGRKPAPYAYLDSHAGVGRYDLAGAPARRTGERRAGIDRIRAAEALPPPLARYRAVVDGEGGGDDYPGSPEIARRLMRDGDVAHLCELHAEDCRELRARYRGDSRIAVHHRDGYEAIGGLLPPRERRGLLLIDPPFESPEEFDQLAGALANAHRRWPQGVLAAWYPLKAKAAVERFHRAVQRSGVGPVLRVELTVLPDDVPGRFHGCGMLIVNPPWILPERCAQALPVMSGLLGTSDRAWRCDWLVAEQAG